MNSPAARHDRMAARRRTRHRAERRFRMLGFLAVWVGLGFLAVLFAVIVDKGAGAFKQTMVRLDIAIEAPGMGPQGTIDWNAMLRMDTNAMIKKALRAAFPDAGSRREKRALYQLVSPNAPFELRRLILDNPDLIGRSATVWVTASDDVDMLAKGAVPRSAPADARRLSDRQVRWIAALEAEGRLETRFNKAFFTSGDSREPESAGIAVALVGSLYSVLVCLALAFPFGVMAAVYLEEFAPKNRWTAFIEVNINNLAAVPSIVFGLLGLALLLNFFNLPRSSPLVGGMVLALMTLPTIIIAGRAALKAVPPSVRDAALAVGASPVQAVFHHVLPLAMPGTLTGTIIGTARAMGETAPLLMVGMVAFVVDVPETILSPATALPVQVFLWADHPERAFLERTAAAILVLLVFTCAMNLLAMVLRRRFEVRW